MNRLPPLQTDRIPVSVTVRKNTEVQQYLQEQGFFWTESAQKWVQEVAGTAHLEIVRAGNPKFTAIEIDGTTGRGVRKQWRQGRPGTFFQASKSVRVLYQANELARDWVWWVVRRSNDRDEAIRSRAEPLGGTVNTAIGIYDILYLVPDSPKPAEYAWFANNLSKQMHVRRRQRRRKDSPVTPRDRRLGYLGEAVRRMRGQRAPGVVVWGMFISKGLTAPFARNDKGLLPVVGVSFRRLQHPLN
jgi:hypothetical protein